jgi:4-hydroxy-3-polyprenylbenzoate decarboxylase
MRWKEAVPEIVDWFPDTRSVGVTYVSINKTSPGQGLEVAQRIAERDYFSKVVIVVDADLDITDQRAMLGALGARWQPYGNTHIYEAQPALPLDPSSVRIGKSSKIAIDATRQWPEEGGRSAFPAMNETTFREGAPDAITIVDRKWGEKLRNWRPKLD